MARISDPFIFMLKYLLFFFNPSHFVTLELFYLNVLGSEKVLRSKSGNAFCRLSPY